MPELIFYNLEVSTSSNDAPAEAAQFANRSKVHITKFAQWRLKTQHSTAHLQDYYSVFFYSKFYLFLFIFLE